MNNVELMVGPIQCKIARLAAGVSPRVLDIFAGCGGLSLGFRAAGYQIQAAMEIDPLAALSHATNFYRGAEADLIALHAKARDITMIEPEELVAELSLGDPHLAFDILIGGPP